MSLKTREKRKKKKKELPGEKNEIRFSKWQKYGEKKS